MFLYEICHYKFGAKHTTYAYGKTTIEEPRYWLLLDEKKNTVMCIKSRDFVSATKIKDTVREVPAEHELTKDIPAHVRSIKSKPRPNRTISKNNRTKKS